MSPNDSTDPQQCKSFPGLPFLVTLGILFVMGWVLLGAVTPAHAGDPEPGTTPTAPTATPDPYFTGPTAIELVNFSARPTGGFSGPITPWVTLILAAAILLTLTWLTHRLGIIGKIENRDSRVEIRE